MKRTPTPGYHIGAKDDVPCTCHREPGNWGRHVTWCVNAEHTQHTMGEPPSVNEFTDKTAEKYPNTRSD